MNKPITTLALTASVGLALAACQNSATKQHAALPPAPPGSTLPMRDRPVSEIITPLGGPVDGYARTTLLARQRLEAQRQGPQRMGVGVIDEGPRDARPVSLAFKDLDAKDALRIVIGELLGRSFIIAPDVKGLVTLDVHADLSTQDLYDLLDALSVVYGWSIEERQGGYIVRSAKTRAAATSAPILQARAANPSEHPGVRVYPVRYISAQQAAEAIKPLLDEGGVSLVAGRLLVVADAIAQLNRLGDLLRALDTPAFQGASIWTYELANQTPADAAKVLDAIAQASGLSAGGDSLATFVPLPRTPRLMVIARDPTLQPMLRDWVERVDQPLDAPERYDYVYHIQNYDPGELKGLLSTFYKGRLEEGVNNPNDRRMRLVVSSEEDLLLIRATPADYADLMAMLAKIDRPRQQVHLQAVIAEVTLSDSLEYGVNYFLTTDTGSGVLDLAGSLTQFSPANPAGSAVFLAGSGFAVIDALKSISNISILSAPSTFVRDKDEGMLQVGARVPIITAAVDSSTQVAGTSGVRNEVQYQDTGIIFAVTPKINESGDVTLNIRLEVTDAVPTTSSGIDSPTFTTRIAQTVVTVPHGKTVLVGGAIEQRTADRNSRIPLLGDIPGLGAAFGSKQHTIDRTELLLTITPTIVNDPEDTSLIVSEFVKGARALRDALDHFNTPLPAALRLTDAGRPDERLMENRTGVALRSPRAVETPPQRDLIQLASDLPIDADEESAAVALFLEGLAAKLSQANDG